MVRQSLRRGKGGKGLKLLVLTQKVDRDDPVLGFFHGWLIEFARRFEQITVVCLEEGEHLLPQNVEVLSLGKELGASRFQYIGRFYRYLFSTRNRYESVLVHMNQEYVLLGGVFWWLLGKRIAFWYNHTYGNAFTRLAGHLSHVVLHTSPYAFTAVFRNARRMPAGINTELFSPRAGQAPKSRSVLFVGRLSPLKDLATLIDAVELLAKQDEPFSLTIVGEAPERDRAHAEGLKGRATRLPSRVLVDFRGAISNETLPDVYRAHEIFVNLTPSGNFDKSVLEAMSSGTLVVASSRAFEEVLPVSCRFAPRDAKDLGEKLAALFTLPENDKQALRIAFRDYAVSKHSLSELGERLVQELSI